MSEQISPTLFCGMTAEEVCKLKEYASKANEQCNDLLLALIDIAETNASKHGTTKMMLDRAIFIANEAIKDYDLTLDDSEVKP